jgi:hypothetical protein
MINLLANLVDRALERAPVLQRRQPSPFEPVHDAALTLRHDDAGDSLVEDEMFAESKSAILKEPDNEVHAERIGIPRSSSQLHQHSTEGKTPPRQAMEVTATEPKPQLRQPVIDIAHQQNESTIREESLVQDVSNQHTLNRPKSLVREPSIVTVVERKVEREISLIDRDDARPVEQTNLLVQPSRNSRQPATDDVISRRPETRKQTSAPTADSILRKRAEQRRPPRKDTQRSVRTRLESEPAQRAGPPTPTINVTIGRVEVRATTATKRPDRPRPASPKLSLEDYLQGRSKGN